MCIKKKMEKNKYKFWKELRLENWDIIYLIKINLMNKDGKFI